MAFSKRTPLSLIFLHKNECISTSAVVIVLLAYRIASSKKRIYSFDILKRAARGTLYFVGYFPKGILVYTQAAVAVLAQYSLVTYIRNVLNPICGWRWYRSPNYLTYPTKEAEQRYWDSARLLRRQLQSSDARFCLSSSGHKSFSRDNYEDCIPVISSYQPALPPLRNSYDLCTRNKPRNSFDRSAGREYHLPTKAFCKWYRMTHPDQNPFDLVKASQMMRKYDADEKREIHRISRLISNKKAFRSRVDSRRYQYQDMWNDWQKKHSLGVEIVFEEE